MRMHCSASTGSWRPHRCLIAARGQQPSGSRPSRSATLRTPTLTIRKCPECGEEIEVFSNDIAVSCSRCGFTVYNDALSCVQWCRYAKECVGEETCRRLTSHHPEDTTQRKMDDAGAPFLQYS